MKLNSILALALSVNANPMKMELAEAVRVDKVNGFTISNCREINF
jgi:hypothetical protein